MSTPTPSEYLEAGCTLCNASMGVFLAILVLTNKKPCTECPYKKGCEAHKKLFAVNHATYTHPSTPRWCVTRPNAVALASAKFAGRERMSAIPDYGIWTTNQRVPMKKFEQFDEILRDTGGYYTSNPISMKGYVLVNYAYGDYTEMNRRWALVTEDVKEVRKDQWWRRWPRRAWGVLTIERNSPGMLELGTYAYYVAIGWAFLTSLLIYLNNYS